MKIQKIKINNFRCFPAVEIDLGIINTFVGPNNVGKSSILRAISVSQAGGSFGAADIRAGMDRAEIVLTCDNLQSVPIDPGSPNRNGVELRITLPRPPAALILTDETNARRNQIPETASASRFVPYYSKRKLAGYSEDVRASFATGAFNMAYLSSKLNMISAESCPGHEEYRNACRSILGFVLAAIPSENGARPGIFLPDGSSLYLEQMGEGVPSIAALLIELVTASDKIFLIEEPENDLHPTSLKALLEMILISSSRNQFIVTTHSNIVVQYLGSGHGNVFEVAKVDSAMPTASVERVQDTVSARTGVLRKLGYSLSDFDLWDGWLILEESSAERLIRDYLIPWFVPRLTNVRLLSSDGVDNAEPTYAALHRMVLYTHLQEIYRDTTWVRLDGDAAGIKVTSKLKSKFTQVALGQFGNFSQARFENYYPEEFSDRIKSVFSVEDAQVRRVLKKQLLLDVLNWLDEDEPRAKVELAKSAAEVIDFLKEVYSTMRQNVLHNQSKPPPSS
jgi:hypothetical protein